jgi:hypothetical protein
LALVVPDGFISGIYQSPTKLFRRAFDQQYTCLPLCFNFSDAVVWLLSMSDEEHLAEDKPATSRRLLMCKTNPIFGDSCQDLEEITGDSVSDSLGEEKPHETLQEPVK